ncbi:MAG: hypothetical protein CVU46_10580 [Chloroflexi bacterium HGW-Chloroflexi-8]|jgi:hypothetical protein|nr:MAG: hypothetical protein CVU46_10580 [Chloroflexi bacterium HGW-Chloroflexi-8]
MLEDSGRFVNVVQHELVSPGGWILTERNVLVNLDKIESAEIQTLHDAAFDAKVVLYPSSQDEPYVACTGSKDKCKDYLRILTDYLGAKKLVAFEYHPCSCKCGCKEEIIEGFEICDNCVGEHSLAQESMVFK